MKLLHSADWQIGARFRQFGEQGADLREARLRTLRRALQEAEARAVDAFLIAGDLFEDNQIEAQTVSAVFELLASFDRVPIFILPGNHDPFTGPASIWGRKPFAAPPPHLKVFTAAEAVPLADGWLLASPLTQKRSSLDPTMRFAEMLAAIPEGAIKAGVTHGSPAIESRHQGDDFPIALDAASRLGLDYLALGHWHRTLSLDGGRMLMPGTPEPTDFSESGAGFIHQVEIFARSTPPTITPIRVGEREWRALTMDLTEPERDRAQIEQIFSESCPDPARWVVRITLKGSASGDAVTRERAWLTERLAACGIVSIVDETSPEFSPADLHKLRQEHPLIGLLLADLDALAAYAGGLPLPAGMPSGFTAPEFLALCESIGCEPAAATPEFFAFARRSLLRELREAAPSC